ncbi:uncharacterized protein LOC127138016 [Lathyrus oleraceus]|uniref:uncharacterized protein LOC127138016 n=1 Tax=Pisum sativum TaxID=3888 RepID=UPI0021CF84F1|nr:uncharacterized protein LOC127138016 [Pisum sativum]
MHFSEDDKVVFASHMMRGPTVRWWKNVSTLMTNQGVPRDWEHFKITFLHKYFPSTLRTQKEFEFHPFRQGNMPTADYAEKFKDMDAYSRKAMYAPDEKWKVDQFLFGLKELLRQCYVAGNSLKKVREERDQYRVGLKDQGRPSHQLRLIPQSFKGKTLMNAKSTQPPQCQVCKRFYFRKCVGGVFRCFTCHKEGHMARDCPQKNAQAQGKSIARVYTLNAKKDKGNS